MACRILDAQPGIKPTIPALKVQSSKWRVNHCIPREVPITGVFFYFKKKELLPSCQQSQVFGTQKIHVSIWCQSSSRLNQGKF